MVVINIIFYPARKSVGFFITFVRLKRPVWLLAQLSGVSYRTYDINFSDRPAPNRAVFFICFLQKISLYICNYFFISKQTDKVGAPHKKKREEKYGFAFWYAIFDERDLVTHKTLRSDVAAAINRKGNAPHIIAEAVRCGYLDKSQLEDSYSLNEAKKIFFINSGETLAPREFGA